jgi:hypothetical protein
MTRLKRYACLRPRKPTPRDELCTCRKRHPVILSGSFDTTNPINCAGCGYEVIPERFELSDDLVRALAHWASLCAAFDRLWLDSSTYEAFARHELETITSRINQLGLSAARSFNRIFSCFLALPFPEPSEPGFAPLSKCPECRRRMKTRRYGSSAYRACDHCRILSWDDNPHSRQLRLATAT